MRFWLQKFRCAVHTKCYRAAWALARNGLSGQGQPTWIESTFTLSARQLSRCLSSSSKFADRSMTSKPLNLARLNPRETAAAMPQPPLIMLRKRNIKTDASG
jgi:hypothetical protein